MEANMELATEEKLKEALRAQIVSQLVLVRIFHCSKPNSSKCYSPFPLCHRRMARFSVNRPFQVKALSQLTKHTSVTGSSLTTAVSSSSPENDDISSDAEEGGLVTAFKKRWTSPLRPQTANHLPAGVRIFNVHFKRITGWDFTMVEGRRFYAQVTWRSRRGTSSELQQNGHFKLVKKPQTWPREVYYLIPSPEESLSQISLSEVTLEPRRGATGYKLKLDMDKFVVVPHRPVKGERPGSYAVKLVRSGRENRSYHAHVVGYVRIKDPTRREIDVVMRTSVPDMLPALCMWAVTVMVKDRVLSVEAAEQDVPDKKKSGIFQGRAALPVVGG